MENNRENIFTVSEVNKHLKNVVENNIPNLFVEGEIANFIHHRSGHMYFSLKDESSTLRCVFFKYSNLHLNFKPKAGDQVICGGKLTVYEKGGSYQININRMMLSGVGELQLRFEKLKKQLAEEGLFDEIHKQPIPQYPEKVGVITSSTGAAIEDIKNVITRRFPTKIFLYPATVQGDKAASEIIKGISFFNSQFPVDILIVGRGGGSQEDLFCFNDEQLARAIFASEIPIISAVGHEIDFTISDFAADLRAPTPSAAAELAVPNKDDLKNTIISLQNAMRSSAQNYFYSRKIEIQEFENALSSFHPKNKLLEMHNKLDNITLKLINSIGNKLENSKNKLNILINQLQELSPREALKRGYSIIRLEKKLINSVTKLSEGDNLELILSDGKCNATVKNIENTK